MASEISAGQIGSEGNFRVGDNTGVERHFFNPAVQLRATVIGIGTGSRA